MAKTVNEGFEEFHRRLTPLRGESEAAKRHRASIEACLKANFEITRFWRTGSFGNGTSIRSYSDVDYFASIPPRHQRSNSTTMLRLVRDALDARVPRTGVRVLSPAVLVPFGTDASESTEVVPAYLAGTRSGGDDLIYNIANGIGGWMPSSPDAHNNYVAAIFRKVYDSRLPAFQDPMGVSGLVVPCASSAQKQDALSKLSTAHTRAQQARAAEQAGKIREAFSWWDLLYDGHFPAYG